MSLYRRTAWLLIGLGLIAALAAPWLIRLNPPAPQTRTIELTARRFAYSPARIVVNRGDTVVIKATSADVTHGFLLDGYDVEAVIKPQGLIFQKYTWEDDDGAVKADWDKVPAIEFVTDKSGKFAWRCNQTCGTLHPFMTGELVVRDNTVYHLAVSLSIWLVFGLMALFAAGYRFRPSRPKRSNLLDKGWIRRLVMRRDFQFLVILPNLLIFYLLIIAALFGSPVGNHNIGIIFVWILWWTALKAILVPFGGRAWCCMCPLPAPAEWLARKAITGVRYFEKPLAGWHHRLTGLQKKWPRRLSNMWLQNALFLAMISFGIILITRPLATAVLFAAIIAATLVLSLIFRGRAFCLYLCPVGGFLSTYSLAGTLEIRAVDPGICKRHKEKECFTGGPGGWACPWGQYVGRMDRNAFCGLCTECLKSCPKGNVGLFVRPFGADLKLKGYDELFNVVIMLVVGLAFSITMLGPWSWIKNAANVTENRQLVPFLLYVGTILSLALAVVPGLFALAVEFGRRLAGGGFDFKALLLRLGYVFIPVGLFVWIAFSLPQVMINYGYILNVLSDPLGLGWDLFGTAHYPFKPFFPEYIPHLQGALLLAGLYFGLTRGYAALEEMTPDPAARTRLILPAAILFWGLTNVFLRFYLG